MPIKLLKVSNIARSDIMANFHLLSCIISVWIIKVSIITFVAEKIMNKMKKWGREGWLWSWWRLKSILCAKDPLVQVGTAPCPSYPAPSSWAGRWWWCQDYGLPSGTAVCTVPPRAGKQQWVLKESTLHAGHKPPFSLTSDLRAVVQSSCRIRNISFAKIIKAIRSAERNWWWRLSKSYEKPVVPKMMAMAGEPLPCPLPDENKGRSRDGEGKETKTLTT